MNLEDFGSESHPIRCSYIPKIFQCPLRAVMEFNHDCEDTSGPAADTGSAVHKAIEEWYRHRFSVKDAVQAMALALPQFPQADLRDAESQFVHYAADPRNAQAKIIACEKEVEFTLDCSPNDATGKRIYIRGTLDQIRDEGGVFRLWDVKTSKRQGLTILREHLLQQAAYMYGASAMLGRIVQPGGVIMTRKYGPKNDPRTSPMGVYFHYALSYDAMMLALDGLRDIVANIRSGAVWANPGDYCEWCPMGGHDACLPKFLNMVTK
jgi:hypothetical protein